MKEMTDSTMTATSRAIFVLGAPSFVGGADTELWHTLRIWRRFGLELHLIPAGCLSTFWRGRCEELGCTIHDCRVPDELPQVPGLRDGTVVSFCNRYFLEAAACLRRLGCRLVWVNCMTWVFAKEHEHYREHGLFDHYIFQTRYQQSRLVRTLQEYGYRAEQGHLIRGAFDIEEFPFRPLPHAVDAPFVVGRISRPDADKYHSNTWSMYAGIGVPTRARLMAWNDRIEAKLGPPPAWATCLPTAAETPQEFLAQLHCMIQVNGGARENWPRSGLEAMATGVPIVAQNAWGWQEMLRHGQTGFLADEEQEISDYTTRLAYDEPLRLDIVRAARQALEQELANPHVLWQAWKEVFDLCSRN